MNKRETQLILEKHGIKPNKKLGQNFLFDKNIISKIISESHVLEDDIILEIGPGLGALTEALVKCCNKLHAYEIDFKLFQYLTKKFSKNKNLLLYNEDILKADIPQHNIVISNIPYTITGAIMEKVFYTENPPRGALIIENSIAERIFSKNQYKKFSRITVSFNAFMEPIKKHRISRFTFIPTPKIDLALIIIKPREDIAQFLLDEKQRKFFLKFVSGIMPYKNKNVINAINLFLNKEILGNLSKDDIYKYIDDPNLIEKKIAQCEVDEIVDLSKLIFDLVYN
ncbi:MAG: ribosomal RNA small subunit methyltransferase A [Candidatus Lokiarchaeota archaeon]|nr:ribosomal RNA small subunit methyltransferase A [Candidatus Lokiarchaeota archaeon]